MASDSVSARRSREVLAANGISSGDLQGISSKGTREELGELRNLGFQSFPMKLAMVHVYLVISNNQHVVHGSDASEAEASTARVEFRSESIVNLI